MVSELLRLVCALVALLLPLVLAWLIVRRRQGQGAAGGTLRQRDSTRH